MGFIYKKAGMEDIGVLVKTRIEVLRAANGLSHEVNMAFVEKQSTTPDCRRKGVAYHTLELLIEEARKRGVGHISLEATDMGRPLYERYGFVEMNDEMVLPQKLLQLNGQNDRNAGLTAE
ncbi:GNAT family N-acetyltransferase [Clostridiaceae bacterium]|nr:GNAT family N-acetyltransferase [Clostridiaceae bacterium]RKI13876.1 GNAT family N-acetyltransferase [bacterium 1XD21-70]